MWDAEEVQKLEGRSRNQSREPVSPETLVAYPVAVRREERVRESFTSEQPKQADGAF